MLIARFCSRMQCISLHLRILFAYLRPARGIAVCIFSKDRPLQLDATLGSLGYYSSNVKSITVLYRSSDDRYETAYAQLFAKYPNVNFRKEKEFRKDLICLLQEISAGFVQFLVDDDIFLDHVDYHNLEAIASRKVIPSLRLHPRVTYSYTTDSQQRPPQWVSEQITGLKIFRWPEQGPDWSYPISLDGNIFARQLALFMIRKTQFRAPNSLEAMLQKFAACIRKLMPGACYDKPKLINIAANRVQDEFFNRAGQVSPGYLLEKFNEGYVIDFASIASHSFDSVHIEYELPLVRRG